MPWKEDEGLLMIKARWLVGKTLSQVEDSIRQLDDASRVKTKAGAAYVTEHYFGIPANSGDEPDFPKLGIELKSVPLKEKNGLLTVKEPLSLNMLNYMKEWKCDDINESSFYRKNKRILFVCYVHKGEKRSDYVIRYVFIWNMDGTVLDELRPDFDRIITKIRAGNATDLHQRYDRYLTTCPKHNGKFKDPKERTSKIAQPFNDTPGERKAYRLKTTYMSLVISRDLGVSLQRSGRGLEAIWWRDTAGGPSL